MPSIIARSLPVYWAVLYTVLNPGSVIAATSAVDVPIGFPGAVATDTRGNVYFSSQNVVFKLDDGGHLSRIAGNGTRGYAGDGGPAVDAQLDIPLTYSEFDNDPIDFGPLVGGVAVDDRGNVFIADAYNNRIRKVDPAGNISTFAGTGSPGYPTPANDMRIGWPQGLAEDAAGNLYVTSAWGPLSRISSDGQIAMLVGVDCRVDLGRNGFCAPEQVALDGVGNLYVVDSYCRVGRVGRDASITVVAGDGRPDYRHGMAFTCGYSGDGGPAIGAALSMPYGVGVDNAGNVYVADTENHCVRKVDPAGIITTFAGVCQQRGFAGDGGPATSARLATPSGIATDGAGNVFIADFDNGRIRKVAPDGIITTVAGNGGPYVYVAGDVGTGSGSLTIEPGFTGSWYNPAQSGHGFQLEVLPGTPKRLLASWFTFAPQGGQAWIVGQGPIDGNQAVVQGIETGGSGALFPPNFDAANVQVETWGTLTFSFNDCNHGHVEWASTIPGYGSGAMDLVRLTLPAGLICQIGGAAGLSENGGTP